MAVTSWRLPQTVHRTSGSCLLVGASRVDTRRGFPGEVRARRWTYALGWLVRNAQPARQGLSARCHPRFNWPQIHQRPPHRDPHPSAAVRQRLCRSLLSVGPTTSYPQRSLRLPEVAGMSQPTQNPATMRNICPADTPVEAADQGFTGAHSHFGSSMGSNECRTPLRVESTTATTPGARQPGSRRGQLVMTHARLRRRSRERGEGRRA
jgi:hypothetical protein